MKKKIKLTIFNIVHLVFFFLLPQNRKWFTERIITYWNDFRIQKNHLNIEHRKIERWKRDYVVSKQIADSFAVAHISNAIVLIPPSAYFKERKTNYHVPEPAVFYYYTGLKTIWINSSHAMNANWMVTANNGVLKMIPVTDKNVLKDSLAAFKKFPLSL